MSGGETTTPVTAGVQVGWRSARFAALAMRSQPGSDGGIPHPLGLDH
ncbi:hypothetical protein [Thiohalomonas denitrificans]|nr:hypothetical protein [Thiohalomonas denitrificans]